MDLQAFGQFLREAREQREVSLNDAVKTLKIQRRILESFEEGDFSQGGSPVQVRGMLRNYARFLRLEEDSVLGHYETALIPPKSSRWAKKTTEETQSVKPVTQPRRETLTAIPLSGSGRRNSGPRFAWIGRLFTTLLGIGLIGIIVFFVGQILNHTPPPEGNVQPTLAGEISTLDPTLATATYTATWTPIAFEPSVTPLFTGGTDGFALDMTFVQRSWSRVLIDGEEKYVGIARPGDTQTYRATETVEITLANAAAVELSINGQTQASFGTRGEQVTLLVNSQGLQIIRPNATPTIDASRIISPETFALTMTLDPAALITPLAETPTLEPTLTPLIPTPIGAETLVPAAATSTEVLAAQAANLLLSPTPPVEASATERPNPTASDAVSLPTLTPFSFMQNAATDAPATTALLPSPTPFNLIPPTASDSVNAVPTTQPTQSSATGPIAPTPQAQTRPSATPRPSAAPTRTATATTTPTSDVRPTAIVPLRVTQAGLPTRKAP